MNKNNNAINKEDICVMNDSTMLHSGNSSTQRKNQEMGSLPVTSHHSKPSFDGVSFTENAYSGDKVFRNSPVSASVPLVAASFVPEVKAEVNSESPPLFHTKQPRPFHSPSRSLSMPPLSVARPPPAFGQFNVRHIRPNQLVPAYSGRYTGAHSLMPVNSTHDGYRPTNNLSSQIVPRYSTLHTRCPGVPVANYRPSTDMTVIRAPYSNSIVPSAAATNTSTNNHPTDKETKETTNTRKKRKACGHCEPCRRKENCGSCMNCINRAKGKQICIHRKCEVLKKKPGTSSYSSSYNLNQEKRKDTEGNVFTKEAKRNKNNKIAVETPPALLHSVPSSYSDFGDQPHLLNQNFADRNILPRIHSEFIPPNDHPLLSGSNLYEQFSSPLPGEVGAASSNISQPIEDDDFISQTLHQIEAGNNLTSHDGFPSTLHEGVEPLRSASSHPQLHQLQPTIGESECSTQSWKFDYSEKLFKSFSSEDDPLFARQTSSVMLHSGSDNHSNITESDQFLDTGNLQNVNNYFNSPNVTDSSEHLKDFSSNYSTLGKFPRNNIPEQTAYNQNNILNQENYFSGNQDGKFTCDVTESLQENKQNHEFVTQLSSPFLSQSSLVRHSKALNTLTSSSSHPETLNSNVAHGSQNIFQPKSSSDSIAWNESLESQFLGNPHFGMGHEERFLDSLNSGTIPEDSHWLNLSRPTSNPIQYSNVAKPSSNIQFSDGHSKPKANSGNSVQNLHLQKNLSSEAPMSSQSVRQSDQNMETRMRNLPSSTTDLPRLQTANASPAPSMPHLSPIHVPNSSNLTQRTANDIPRQSASDFLMNGSQSWHEQHNSEVIPTLNYRAHVAHTIPSDPNFVQNTASQLHVNPVSNHFLAQPGSRHNSKNFLAPSNENIANRKEKDALSDGNVSTSAVRCFGAESLTKNESNSSCLSNNHSTSVAQHFFTETMNSVLYGHPQSNDDAAQHSKHSNFNNDTSALKITPLVHVVESPSDVHATISPGESGYDSTEPSSVTSENSSLMPQGLNDLDIMSINKQSGQPKNVQAALMGNKDERVFSYEFAFATTDAQNDTRSSPIKAAYFQAPSLKNFVKSSDIKRTIGLPQNDFPSSPTDNFPSLEKISSNRRMTRCTSFDAGYPDYNDFETDDIFEPSKPKIDLRRYSLQGHIGSKAERTSCISDIVATSNRKARSKKRKNKSKTIFVEITTDSNFPVEFPPRLPCNFSQASTNVNSSSMSFTDNLDRLSSKQYADSSNCDTSDSLRGRVVTCKSANGNLIKKTVFPHCNCLSEEEKVDEAPYYTHLGSAFDIAGIRRLFEDRTGHKGKALRIEKIVYTGKEGKTSRGCPVAKWIFRRSNIDEKVLIMCRERPGHHCSTKFTVVMIMLWEGLDRSLADSTYDDCIKLIPNHGVATERRCGTNEERTCACQGFDDTSGGASFSFGCSWSMYYNGCKFARSSNPNKFKLAGSKDHEAENLLANTFQHLATLVSCIYKKAAPEAHKNQTELESEGLECRLGYNPPCEGRPFSGVTCCMDFCAHSHKDKHNMDNGTTVVVTLTKPENRVVGMKPQDEQLHVLPLYCWDPTGEDGITNTMEEKVKNGAVEILSGFRRAIRLRDKPQGTSKQRKEKRRRAELMSVLSKRGKKGSIKKCLSLEDISRSGLVVKSGNRELANVKDGSDDFHHRNSSDKTQHSSTSVKQAPQSASPSHLNFISTLPPRWPYRRHVGNSAVIPVPFSPTKPPPIRNSFQFQYNLSPMTEELSSPLPDPQQSPSPKRYGRRYSLTLPSDFDSFEDCPLVGHFLSSTDDSTPICHAASSDSPNLVENFMKSESIDRSYEYDAEEMKTYMQLGSFPEVKGEVVASPSLFDSTTYPRESSSPNKKIPDQFSDSEEIFRDPDIGGLAVAPCHGSILIECAKKEIHATTSLLKPNRFHPSRISLVFYQHKNMNYRNHGAAEYVAKETKRNQEKAEKQLKADEKETQERGISNSHHQAHFQPYSLPYYVSPKSDTSHYLMHSSVTSSPSLHKDDFLLVSGRNVSGCQPPDHFQLAPRYPISHQAQSYPESSFSFNNTGHFSFSPARVPQVLMAQQSPTLPSSVSYSPPFISAMQAFSHCSYSTHDFSLSNPPNLSPLSGTNISVNFNSYQPQFSNQNLPQDEFYETNCAASFHSHVVSTVPARTPVHQTRTYLSIG